MKHKQSILRFLLMAVLSAAVSHSCDEKDNPSGGRARPGEYRLPLIETTDIHGYIVSFDNNAIHYRLAYIADKAEDIRGHGDQYDKDRLLLLDGGDLYQGASVSNLLEGRPIYISMDRMDYDAVAVGNHEFDWGLETLAETDATLPAYDWEGQHYENEVPVLCANLFQDDNPVPFTRDYVIVEKKAASAKGGTVPVRIGIVGFAFDYSSSIMASKFTGKGYHIREDFSIANGIASQLESSGQCDATILLIHGSADNAAERLGADSAFDLVLGGHSHITLSGKTGWGLPYLQGGRYCEHYAYADLRFNVDDEGHVSFAGVDNMKTPEVDASLDVHENAAQNIMDISENILAVSYRAVMDTQEQMNDVVGFIKVGATNYGLSGSGGRATAIANWMCDILRSIGEADVSFVNSGGVRTTLPLDGQSSRNITVSNVYELFPFSNTTYVYRITYEDLLTLFNYSMTSAGGSMFSYMTGIDCYYTRTEHSSTAGTYYTYAVHSLRKDGTVIYQNNTWTGNWASRTLTLAVSEYLATNDREDSYTHLSNPLLTWNETPRLLSNTLVDNENAIRILRAQAASSGGLLYIDLTPHFIVAGQ